MTNRTRHRTPADRQAPTTPAGSGEHSHRIPRIVVWGLSLLIAGQLLALGLTAAYAWTVNQRLAALEQYIASKGEQRDAQTADIRDQLRDAVCDVLDQLPADAPALNPLRAEYGCGPGTIPEETP